MHQACAALHEAHVVRALHHHVLSGIMSVASHNACVALHHRVTLALLNINMFNIFQPVLDLGGEYGSKIGGIRLLPCQVHAQNQHHKFAISSTSASSQHTRRVYLLLVLALGLTEL